MLEKFFAPVSLHDYKLLDTTGLGYGRPIAAAFSIIAVLVFVIGCIGMSAPIASSVIVSATLVMETSRREIQHPDGGTVDLLPITEGAAVKTGDLLLRFDGRQLAIDLDSAEAALVMNAATLARLAAEQSGAPAITFPSVVQGIDLHRYPDVLSHEIAFFVARRIALQNRIEEVGNTHADAVQAQASLKEQLDASRIRQEVVNAELAGAQTLAAEGVGTRLRVGTLTSVAASVRADIAVLISHVNENNSREIKSINDVNQIRSTQAEQVAQDVLQAERDRIDLRRHFSLLQGQMARIEIRSPVDGHIINLLVHFKGAVVGPAATIVEIVPDESPMFVEAQIRPSDVAGIAVGSVVRCRLRGKDGRAQQLTATIVSLSADRLVDRQRGTPYFALRAKLDRKFASLPELRNGMPLDIMIDTGQATIAERFTRPIISLFESDPESR